MKEKPLARIEAPVITMHWFRAWDSLGRFIEALQLCGGYVGRIDSLRGGGASGAVKLDIVSISA